MISVRPATRYTQLDPANAVDRDHPLNRGRVAWLYTLPGLAAGLNCPNLSRPNRPGTLQGGLLYRQLGSDPWLFWDNTSGRRLELGNNYPQLPTANQPMTVALDVVPARVDATRCWVALGENGSQLSATMRQVNADLQWISHNGTTQFGVNAAGVTIAVNTRYRVYGVFDPVAGYSLSVFGGGFSGVVATSADTTLHVASGTQNPQYGRRINNTQVYSGSMKDMSIWTRALSLDEIDQDYRLSLQNYQNPDSPLRWLGTRSYFSATGGTPGTATVTSATIALTAPAVSATGAARATVAAAGLVWSAPTVTARGSARATVAAAGVTVTAPTVAARGSAAASVSPAGLVWSAPTVTAGAGVRANVSTASLVWSAPSVFARGAARAAVGVAGLLWSAPTVSLTKPPKPKVKGKMSRPIDDYKSWDHREDITYISERNSGDVTYSLIDCKRRQLTFRELAASAGVYTGQDRAWLVPVAVLPAGLVPKMADRIRDEDGNTWTVIGSPELNTWQTWWKLPTRNIVLQADLRHTINILRPTNTQDASGNRVPAYSAVYSSIPCRVQEQSGSTVSQFGKLATSRTYTIYLGQRVIVTNEDRVEFASSVLQIVRSSNPDRIDQLQELECEVLP